MAGNKIESIRRIIRGLVRFTLFIAGGIILFILVVAAQVWFFAQRDEARPAGAAIVLGAAVYGNRPSPVLRERINHAISLYEAGLVETIIFTGGQGQPNEPPEAIVGRQYALAQGVPAAAILVETTSTTTWENLTNAGQVAEAAGIETFLIVSTPYHMRRALSMAADLDLEAYSSPTRTTRWISPRTQTRAFLREVAAYGVYLLIGAG